MRNFSSKKLFLDLLVTGLLVVTGWIGYQVFILHQWSPLVGSAGFLVDISVLVWFISVLHSRYYRHSKPSFKSVFLSLFGISVVLAFAGVEPLVGFKDTMLVTVGLTFLILILLSPFIIWFILYFVIGPVFRIR